MKRKGEREEEDGNIVVSKVCSTPAKIQSGKRRYAGQEIRE